VYILHCIDFFDETAASGSRSVDDDCDCTADEQVDEAALVRNDGWYRLMCCAMLVYKFSFPHCNRDRIQEVI